MSDQPLSKNTTPMSNNSTPMSEDQFLELLTARFVNSGVHPIYGWQRTLISFAKDETELLNEFGPTMHDVIRRALAAKELSLIEDYKIGIENSISIHGVEGFRSFLTPTLDKVTQVPLTDLQIKVLYPYAVDSCRVTHHLLQMRPC